MYDNDYLLLNTIETYIDEFKKDLDLRGMDLEETTNQHLGKFLANFANNLFENLDGNKAVNGNTDLVKRRLGQIMAVCSELFDRLYQEEEKKEMDVWLDE